MWKSFKIVRDVTNQKVKSMSDFAKNKRVSARFWCLSASRCIQATGYPNNNPSLLTLLSSVPPHQSLWWVPDSWTLSLCHWPILPALEIKAPPMLCKKTDTGHMLIIGCIWVPCHFRSKKWEVPQHPGSTQQLYRLAFVPNLVGRACWKKNMIVKSDGWNMVEWERRPPLNTFWLSSPSLVDLATNGRLILSNRPPRMALHISPAILRPVHLSGPSELLGRNILQHANALLRQRPEVVHQLHWWWSWRHAYSLYVIESSRKLSRVQITQSHPTCHPRFWSKLGFDFSRLPLDRGTQLRL